MNVCGEAFESFVINSLYEEEKEHSNKCHNDVSETEKENIDYDAYFPNGLAILGTNGKPTFVEIKYTNKPQIFDQTIRRFFEKNREDQKIMLCLIDASTAFPEETFFENEKRIIHKGYFLFFP